MMRHLLFSVDHVQCALPLESIRIVLQMVQPGSAPELPSGASGTVDLHGQIIPIWSVRSFFGIPDCTPRLTDKLIITQAGPETVALRVDETRVIQQSPVTPAPAGSAETGRWVAPGVELTGDGTFLFADLLRFLASDRKITMPAQPDAIPADAKYTLPGGERSCIPEDEGGRKILAERAEKLAVPGAEPIEAGIVEVLRFQLAYQEYAIEMGYVKEVILTGEITPVPGAPPFISGICAARGQIISLVDLRVLFALPEQGLTDLNRVIVITDGHVTFGILADNITGIGTIPSYLILLPDRSMMPPWKQYMKGYVGSTLTVLDAAAILADPALIIEDK